MTTGRTGFDIVVVKWCLVQLANRSYFGLQKQFKYKLLSRETKCKIYKTLIKPILTYASETWTMTEADIQRLHVFERNILRKIFGPVNDGIRWRVKTNNELYDMYKFPNIVNSIRISRLRWAGHVRRMEESETPKRILSIKWMGREELDIQGFNGRIL